MYVENVFFFKDFHVCLQYRGKSDISNSVMSGCITGGLIGLRGECAMNGIVHVLMNVFSSCSWSEGCLGDLCWVWSILDCNRLFLFKKIALYIFI